MLEHILLTGFTDRAGTRIDIEKRFRNWGLDYWSSLDGSSGVSREGRGQTILRWKVPQAHVVDILAILRAAAQGAKFDVNDVQNQNLIIAEESRSRAEYNDRLDRFRLTYGLDWQRRAAASVLDQSYLKLEVGKVQQFYDQRFQPQNQDLLIIGDIEPEAVEASLQKLFVDMDSGDTLARERRARKVRLPRLALVPIDGTGGNELIGFFACGTSQLESQRSKVAAQVLSVAAQRRFASSLRNYDPPYTSAGISDQIGWEGLIGFADAERYCLQLNATFAEDDDRRGLDAIFSTLGSLAKFGISEEEFGIARTSMEHDRPIKTIDTHNAIEGEIGRSGDDIPHNVRSAEAGPSLTLEDVNAFARTVLDSSRASLVMFRHSELVERSQDMRIASDMVTQAKKAWRTSRPPRSLQTARLKLAPLNLSPPKAMTVTPVKGGGSRLTLANGMTVITTSKQPDFAPPGSLRIRIVPTAIASCAICLNDYWLSAGVKIIGQSGIGGLNVFELADYDRDRGIASFFLNSSAGLQAWVTGPSARPEEIFDRAFRYLQPPEILDAAAAQVLGGKSAGEPSSVSNSIINMVRMRQKLAPADMFGQLPEQVAQKAWNDWFLDTRNITIFVEGVTDGEQIQSLAARFLSGIPERTQGVTSAMIPLEPGAHPYTGAVETGARIVMTFRSDGDDPARVREIADLARTALLNRLRLGEGGIYNVTIASFQLDAPSRGVISFGFSCASESVDKFSRAAVEELNNFFAEKFRTGETSSRGLATRMRDAEYYNFQLLR